jgi:hypothetical protein
MPRVREYITIGDLDRYFKEFLREEGSLKEYTDKDAAKICRRSRKYIEDLINNDVNSIFSYMRYKKVIKPNMEGYKLLVKLLKAGNYAAIDELLSFLPKNFEETTYARMPYLINVNREDINEAIFSSFPKEKAEKIISYAVRIENDDVRENRKFRKYAGDVIFIRNAVSRNGFYIDTSKKFKEKMYEYLNRLDPKKYNNPIILEKIIEEIYSEEIDYYVKKDLNEYSNNIWELGELRYLLFIMEGLTNYYISKLLDEGKLYVDNVRRYDEKGDRNMNGYCFRLKNYKDLDPMLINTSDGKKFFPWWKYKEIATGGDEEEDLLSFRSRKRSRKRSRRKSCKYGRKKSGGCKKKPGRKRSKKRSRQKSCKYGRKKSGGCKKKSGRKRSKKRSRRKSCKYGRKKSGGCKKKPGRKRSRN